MAVVGRPAGVIGSECDSGSLVSGDDMAQKPASPRDFEIWSVASSPAAMALC